MQGLENRSLDRGITLMEILARTGANTLADLHAQSGLPKSTIRRLLGTLQMRRFVRRSLSDQKYRINITLPVSTDAPIPKDLAIYVDVAMPLLSELTREIDWPSDVHILDGHTMRVVDSTRPLSPFHLYRGVVNRSLNIFGAAAGQACLAEMNASQIQEILDKTRGDKRFGLARFNMSESFFAQSLEEARQRGYGLRVPNYVGETVIDDGLAAIGVKIMRSHQIMGAISLLYPKKLMPHNAMAARYLEKLKDTAMKISRDLEVYS